MPVIFPIYIMEDDYLQAQTLSRAFQERFPERKVRVFDTESAFRLQVAEQDEIPGLVICDVMLPWAFPGDREPAERPEDVNKPDSFIRAGNRCYEVIRTKAGDAWKQVPWLFHTVLTKEEMSFAETVHHDRLAEYLGKEASLGDLLLRVHQMLFDQKPVSEEETQFFLSCEKMKQILLEGLSVTSSEGLPDWKELRAAPI